MLRCSVYRPFRLDRIDWSFSCPSYLYGCQYVSISNKIRTFLAAKCPSLISRIFFKCSSSENDSKLLMIKIKELRNGRRPFQHLNLKLQVFWEFSRIISCSPDPSLRPEVRWHDGKEKKTANLVWQAWQQFCFSFHRTSPSFKPVFLSKTRKH